MANGILYSKLYRVNNDGTKELKESLIVENNGETIYVNGELAAKVNQSVDRGDEAIGYDLYPPNYANGTITDLNPLTSSSFTIANILFSSLNLIPVGANLTIQAFIFIASKIIDKNLTKVWFFEKSQLETFPTNVPPGCEGAITRIDYAVDYYRTAVMTETNRIGNKIIDTYYDMP